MIDVCQSMKFQSDREYLGQNYKDTGYLKKKFNGMGNILNR